MFTAQPVVAVSTEVGRQVKHLRLIVVAAIAAVVAGTLLAYWLNPPALVPLGQEASLAVPAGDGKPRLRGLSYTQVKDGVRKWTLNAEGARYEDDSGAVWLENVTVHFYTDTGGRIDISGDEGTYDQKKQVVTLKGNVQGRTEDGNTLTTDWMTYSELEQVADTNAWVTVAGKDYSIIGKGMLVEVPASKVIFKSQVDSTFIPKGKGPPPGVTADIPKDASPAGGQP